MVSESKATFAKPNFAAGVNGLLPAVAQDSSSMKVLMLAWMSEDAFKETVQSGYATYYSRSRGRLWRKGEESGHRQRVKSIRFDCDGDTILLVVEQIGAACHEGYPTCFFRELQEGELITIETRLVEPSTVYGTADKSPRK